MESVIKVGYVYATEYLPQEAIDLCRANIKYISEHAELMTVDELREFVNTKYEQAHRSKGATA